MRTVVYLFPLYNWTKPFLHLGCVVCHPSYINLRGGNGVFVGVQQIIKIVTLAKVKQLWTNSKQTTFDKKQYQASALCLQVTGNYFKDYRSAWFMVVRTREWMPNGNSVCYCMCVSNLLPLTSWSFSSVLKCDVIVKNKSHSKQWFPLDLGEWKKLQNKQ